MLRHLADGLISISRFVNEHGYDCETWWIFVVLQLIVL